MRKLLPTPQASDFVEGARTAPNSNQACLGKTLRRMNKSTFSRGDFPASLFPVPGSDEARMMTVRSGRKCCELLKRLNHNGLLAKTLLGSSIWHSKNVALTWKWKAMKSSRILFQLAPSMPHTDETGCGLLPTMAMGTHGRGGSLEKNIVADLRTGRKPKHQVLLVDKIAAAAMLPTPQTQGMKVCDENGKTRFFKMLATPSATDCQGTHGGGRGKNLRTDLHKTPIENGQGRGLKLQPNFVEWMMGYPQNWTDLNCQSPNTGKTDLSPSATP